jgi:hypothetical protein
VIYKKFGVYTALNFVKVFKARRRLANLTGGIRCLRKKCRKLSMI